MITISKPVIEVYGGRAFLKASAGDGDLGKRYDLWYAVDEKYREFLCDEVADSFVLAMLQIAMHTHQDIKVEGALSSTFHYNLLNTAMPLLTGVVTDGKMVEITADRIFNPGYSPKGVGIGCSLGVDSFASILKQMEPRVPEDYRLTHLFVSRAVHFGQKNLEGAEEAFRKTVENLGRFAEEVGLGLVAVDSNIDVPYLDHNINQLQRGIQCTLSAVLSLQKLFRSYVFASSFPADHFKITTDDVAYCESAFVPSLSTNSTELILATPMMSRVERTRYICNNPLVKKWLDVCWATVIENGLSGNNEYRGRTKRNCGKCLKCLRTLLTMEILGVDLDEYADIFDLNEYRRYRDKYLIFVLSMHKTHYFEDEIYHLVKNTGFHIPLFVNVCSLGVKVGALRVYKFFHRSNILPLSY